MKKLIKVLALALAMMLSVMAIGCGDSDLDRVKENGKLVVGITIYEPMDYIDSETSDWTGFDAELARAFAQQLGVSCQFVIITWSQKVVELNSKQIDLVWNGMTASEELGEKIDFSVSYAKNAQVAVVLNTSDITTKEQIKAASVAVENGKAHCVGRAGDTVKIPVSGKAKIVVNAYYAADFTVNGEQKVVNSGTTSTIDSASPSSL